MQIHADTTRCIGAGQCVATDATLFAQDDEDGTVVVVVEHPEGDSVAKAREAVHLCPSRALSLVETNVASPPTDPERHPLR